MGRSIQKFIGILLVAIVVLFAGEAFCGENNKISIVFRFEDYSGRSSTGMDKKVIKAFGEVGARCTFGVIPYVCSEDIHSTEDQEHVPMYAEKIEILKKAIRDGAIDIALHGYSHQTIRSDNSLGGYSEFDGVSYDEQLEMITQGKDHLEDMLDVSVNIFIPPWNSYDHNTLKALEASGFRGISADIDGYATSGSKLSFLPVTSTLKELEGALASARKMGNTSRVIVVWFHETSFIEVNDDSRSVSYEDFRELLHWLKGEEDVEILSVGEALDTLKGLTAERFLEYKEYHDSFSLLPGVFRPEAGHVYFFSQSLSSKDTRWHILTGVFYLTVFTFFLVIGFFVTNSALKVLPASAMLFPIIGSVLFVVFLIFALRDFDLNLAGALAVSVLAGGSAGAWSSFFLGRG